MEKYSKYDASNLGNIRNNKTKHIMKQNKREGYKAIHIINDTNIRKCVQSHRVICSAFKGKHDDETMIVDHINGIKDDNRIENLRWASRSLQAKNTKSSGKGMKKVGIWKLDPKTKKKIELYPNKLDASRSIGYSTDWSLNQALKNNTILKDFLWSYDKHKITKGEIWKKYSKDVFISNMGNIKDNHNRIVYSNLLGGYFGIVIKGKRQSVHRMVAKTFLDNNDKHPVVNHKNGDKTDNRVENLEWTTYKKNTQHAYDELDRVRSGSRQVLKLDKKSKILKEYPSLKEASRNENMSASTISRHIDSKKSKGGFYWEYKNNDTNYGLTHGKNVYKFNSKTKEIIQEFKSIKSAANSIGEFPDVVSGWAKNQKVKDGFLWSFEKTI
jgi:hypothetical protein